MYDDNIFEDDLDQEEADRISAEKEAAGNSESGEYHFKGAGGTFGSEEPQKDSYSSSQGDYGSYGGYSGGPDDGYNNYYYGDPVYPGGKKSGSGFGIASLIFGILALVFFCSCINIIFAILALIFGLIQIKNYVDRGAKGMAIGGIVTGILSIICFVFFWGALFSGNSKIIDSIGEDDIYRYYYEFGSDESLEDFFNEFGGGLDDGTDDEFDSIEEFENKKGTTI